MAKTASKTRKKSSPDLPKDSPQLRIPITGERVRRQGFDTEYEITYISPDCRYVHIGIPRTNFEHRNVAIANLLYLEKPLATAKPRRNVDTVEIRERLDTVRHSAMDPLSGELAIA